MNLESVSKRHTLNQELLIIFLVNDEPGCVIDTLCTIFEGCKLGVSLITHQVTLHSFSMTHIASEKHTHFESIGMK